MTPRVCVGKRRDAQRARARCHVETIGQQGHRPRQVARDDFANHHQQRQHDNRPGAPRVFIMCFAEKRMFVVVEFVIHVVYFE